MKNSYPELNNGKELIIETLKMKKKSFLLLLERGMKILMKIYSKLKTIFFQVQ